MGTAPRTWARLALGLGPLALSLLHTPRAEAGGLFAGENGSQAQARGGAFVARADDASALMHNPAGLAKTKGKGQLFIGTSLVFFHLRFDRAGVYPTWPEAPPGEQPFAGQEMPAVESDNPPQPVPLIAAALRFDKLAVGFGVIAPQAYPNRKFAETVNVGGVTTNASPQRYDIVEEEALVALPSLAVAYRVSPKLDVGVRGSWGFGTLAATSYVWGTVNADTNGAPIEDVENDGRFDVDVKDTFMPAFGLGFLYRVSPSLELGGAYASKVTLAGTGVGHAVLGDRLAVGGARTIVVPPEEAGQKAQCKAGGTRQDLSACVDLVIPQAAQLGVRYVFRRGGGGGDGGVGGAAGERGDLELDVRWENWSQATNVDVLVDGVTAQDVDPLVIVKDLKPTRLRHGFRDVIAVRLGGSWQLGRVDLRGGLSYDSAAAPTSWTRLDLDGTDRYQVAGGVGVAVSKTVRVDLGGAVIISPTRTVSQVPIADKEDNDAFVQPNAIFPLAGLQNQQYAPINNGTTESGYYIVSAGVSAAW
jgi:long-subunit fatty acid transport protein